MALSVDKRRYSLRAMAMFILYISSLVLLATTEVIVSTVDCVLVFSVKKSYSSGASWDSMFSGLLGLDAFEAESCSAGDELCWLAFVGLCVDWVCDLREEIDDLSLCFKIHLISSLSFV